MQVWKNKTKMQQWKGETINGWLNGGPMQTALGSFKDWKLQRYKKVQWKDAIRDGGSTALYIACTVYTVTLHNGPAVNYVEVA